jgi:hypothetical protein
MTESALWRFGRRWIASVREKKLEARADFAATKLEPRGLTALPVVPPPRHADLHGWPIDKEDRRTRAKELARDLATEPAALVSYPPSGK